MNHVVLPVALILGASCAAGMSLSSHIALEIPDHQVFATSLFHSNSEYGVKALFAVMVVICKVETAVLCCIGIFCTENVALNMVT